MTDAIKAVLAVRRSKRTLNKADRKAIGDAAIIMVKQELEELRIRTANMGLMKTASAIGHAENVCDEEAPTRRESRNE